MSKPGRAGVSISAKSFAASFAVLFFLMMAAGALTRAIPAGSFERRGADGAIIAGSYRLVPRPDYPAWRWFAAPLELLRSPEALPVIVIIAFIAIVGGSFAVLQKSGILSGAVDALARRYASRKRLLLSLVTLLFMMMGSLMGIFEEVLPLVPVAIALSISLGWDILVGMGMSILATGFGFAAAISNPFSIGTAQRLAGLPLFSGAAFRVLVFVLVYALYMVWLSRAAKRAAGAAKASAQDAASPAGQGAASKAAGDECRDEKKMRRGLVFFAAASLFIAAAVMAVSLTRIFADYSMPITAALFLVAGLGSGLVAGLKPGAAARSFGQGVIGILPGIVLILMAVSVKHIIMSGGIMDTILQAAGGIVAGASNYTAAALIYLFTLGMNFFIGSATAKAFLLMPILTPLADLAGISRQVAVQAYVFGDGFSNMIYPTNAVLLISLGIAGVSWPTWLRRTWPLQLGALLLSLGLLMLAVALGYS